MKRLNKTLNESALSQLLDDVYEGLKRLGYKPIYAKYTIHEELSKDPNIRKTQKKTTEKQLQSVIISRDYVHFTTAYNFNTRELITASQKVASDKFPCHPQDVTAGGNSNQLLAKQQLATLSHRHNARIHIVAANKSVLSVSVNASC